VLPTFNTPFAIDDLRFPIPEPGIVWLFAIGLLAVGGTTRRRYSGSRFIEPGSLGQVLGRAPPGDVTGSARPDAASGPARTIHSDGFQLRPYRFGRID
jgi:hypothetical protein